MAVTEETIRRRARIALEPDDDVRVSVIFGKITTLLLAALLVATFVAGIWIDWRWFPTAIPVYLILRSAVHVTADYEDEHHRRTAAR